MGKARYILIAEAVGYQGGRFSGVPMTSERILLGNHNQIKPVEIICRVGERTSNPGYHEFKKTQQTFGMAEPTATIVWGSLLKNHISLQEVVLWNIFPFHPYRSESALLTNRTPSKQELQEGSIFIHNLLNIFPNTTIIAIGKLATETLKIINISHTHVPHPSNGHAAQFRSAMVQYFGRC